jgi:hypothetical protein
VTERPLWEGVDDEFTQYVQQTFGIPASITSVPITQRSSSGRCAIIVGGDAGGIVFLICPTATAGEIELVPAILGSLPTATVVENRIKASDPGAHIRALIALALRHLPRSVVLGLLAPHLVH